MMEKSAPGGEGGGAWGCTPTPLLISTNKCTLLEQHSLAGEGGPNSDDWKESLALCLLCGLMASTGNSVLDLKWFALRKNAWLLYEFSLH
jgi:hypothetical protein